MPLIWFLFHIIWNRHHGPAGDVWRNSSWIRVVCTLTQESPSTMSSQFAYISCLFPRFLKYKLWLQTLKNKNSDQDGRVGKYCASLLSQTRQNYNEVIEQPSLRVAWGLAEQKFYNWGCTKEATSWQVGGMETWNGLVPHPCMAVVN